MAIALTPSDTSRAVQHDPDQTWPTSVTIQLVWNGPGGPSYRSYDLQADRFFGRNAFGAPMDGSALIGIIENMRRAGPVIIEPQRKRKNAKRKKPAK